MGQLWHCDSHQRVARQLLVLRARRRQLALVKAELARRHCTELQRRQRFNLGADLLQARCRALARHRTGTPATCPRQSQMGLEWALVALEPQRVERCANRFNQLLKILTGFDTNPENSRQFRVGKETDTAKCEVNRRPLYLAQCALDVIDFSCFSEKLQRDMKSLRPNPAYIGREWPHLVAELSNPPANVGVNIKGYEQAHGKIMKSRRTVASRTQDCRAERVKYKRDCIIRPLMPAFFAQRTSWNLSPNRYTEMLEAHRQSGREMLDLTGSNPTAVGLRYREDELLQAVAHREALTYEPQPKGLLSAREAIAAYYLDRGSGIWPDDLILTTSTSEAYSFVFRLLCNPGDALLAPAPSYPLFDFLADLQDVKLVPYDVVYDHGWHIDFHSLQTAIDRVHAAGGKCRAVLVVHPNNPTGSYVKAHEAEQLNRICTANELAIIADEVFLDYSLSKAPALTFSANSDALTFTLSGLSKISALPQMKVAWIAVRGPEDSKAEALNRLEVIADTYLSMNAPVQLAVPVMLEERHSIHRQLMYRIRENLAELDSQLAAQKLCQRLEIEGGWYAVLRVPVTGSDEDLAIRLLQETGVLLQPGHFYDFPAEGYLVLSLITEAQTFQQGISRALQFIATNCG